MKEAIDTMAQEIASILDQQLHSFWLYGSVVLDDFQLGWSDIDFIAFSREPITKEQAERLLMLRQLLSDQFPENPFYRCFEGVIIHLPEYFTNHAVRLVYWGTSGQRITDHYGMDAFSKYELAEYGQSVYGESDRRIFPTAGKEELTAAVQKHYDSIRRYAVETDDSLYSCGWLLDIARCVYTLRYGAIISKTQSGVWALQEHIFPQEEALIRTLKIRRQPLAYKDQPEVKQWLSKLGPVVQRYADVLEKELLKGQ